MRERYEPVVVVTGWDPPPPGQMWLKLSGFTSGHRNVLGFLARLGPNLRRLRRATQGAVAVNPHFIGLELLPLMLLRWLRLCPKVILSVHGADIAEAVKSSGWARTLFTWVLSSPRLVGAFSPDLAEQVKRFKPPANVVSVWNAVPANPDSPLARRVESRYVICVAHFVAKKAHDVLLRAFPFIERERPDLRLILVGGDGPERQEIMSLIRSLELGGKV